ncbi:hypothetical protein [Clostridium sp.]|uniref:hypothetical protein n=1 Tax=Clostridium sp. TaxID=1506 RepID=UPI00260DC33C|nr:hypothetical protein [Clostridium sp.]
MVADLSRCSNLYCEKKDICYRYMEKDEADRYQGYEIAFNQICTADTNYIYYSPIEKPIEHQ